VGVLFLSTTHIHINTRIFRYFTSTSTPPCTWTFWTLSSRSSLLLQYSPTKSRHPNSQTYVVMFLLLSCRHFSFHSLKPHIFQTFP
jgi:hypothetical protein